MTTLQRPMAVAAPRLLNLGCGTRCHAAWVNLDLHPQRPGVRRHDVSTPLPFAADAFDAVYHSHVLEHLRPADVPPFLGECHRVLRPGGVLRLAVPDLEQIARLYLDALEGAWQAEPGAAGRHRWLVMELIDQATREQPGGEMLAHLRRNASAWHRLGADGASVRDQLRCEAGTPPVSRWRQRLRGWLCGSWRERLIRRLLGREYELLQLGRFRRGGEVHQWMYDRVSLRALLTEAGFIGFRCPAADESAIPGWERYGLDVLPDGTAAKPDSLYVEADKP